MSSEQRIRGNQNPGKHVSHQSQRQIKKIDIGFRDASGTGFYSGVLNSEKRGLTQPDTGLGRSINESVQYYWKNSLMSNALSRSKFTANNPSPAIFSRLAEKEKGSQSTCSIHLY
ncbi:hypothetical protein SLA2020_381530 [Shorea laevis]